MKWMRFELQYEACLVCGKNIFWSYTEAHKEECRDEWLRESESSGV